MAKHCSSHTGKQASHQLKLIVAEFEEFEEKPKKLLTLNTSAESARS